MSTVVVVDGLAPKPVRTEADSATQLMRRGLAELIGTALLLIAVIGSGIAAQTLSPNDTGLELPEDAVATGAALVAIILAGGSVSGAHLNQSSAAPTPSLGGLSGAQLFVHVKRRG